MIRLEKQYTSILSIAAILAVSILMCPKSSVAADDKEVAGKVIAVRYSGWATRSNESVKQTLKEGDVLYAGDIVDVKHGNHVQIALDDKGENVLHIDGNSLIQMPSQEKHFEVNKGKVYALLDNLKGSKDFAVATPTAIASVRGTYFQVNTNGLATHTTVYHGKVQFEGRYPNGTTTRKNVVIRPGYRGSVDDFGVNPEMPKAISKMDFEEINTVIKTLDVPRDLLDYSAIEVSEESGSLKNKSSKMVGSDNSKKDEEDLDSGKVVF